MNFRITTVAGTDRHLIATKADVNFSLGRYTDKTITVTTLNGARITYSVYNVIKWDFSEV